MSRKIYTKYSQVISNIQSIHLSIADYGSTDKKDLAGTSHTRSARLSIQEHLEKLKETINPNVPLLVLSCRNVMANLRGIGYIDGNNSVACVTEEVIPSRPYFILGQKKGSNSIGILEHSVDDTPNGDYKWFLSGIPVLWDNLSDEEIFKRIVTEAADHSHIWEIFRGNHPKATDNSRKLFEEIQAVFINTLNLSTEEAFYQLNSLAIKYNLNRECNYLHNIIGINSFGDTLYQLIGTGKLEDLGKQIKAMGATRALCVDNSGSTVVQFFPNGYDKEGIQEFAAPNHRQSGTAYLVMELGDKGFEILGS